MSDEKGNYLITTEPPVLMRQLKGATEAEALSEAEKLAAAGDDKNVFFVFKAIARTGRKDG